MISAAPDESQSKKGLRQTEPELILCAVRWYLRYSLSFRDVEELLSARVGLAAPIGPPAFLGSGGDQRALELRDASKDGEHHSPGRRRRIGPGLGNGLQSGVFCLDSLRDAQQLGRGAREAVQASDDNDVIGAQLGEQALERGPLLAGAGGFLLEQLFAAGRIEA